MSGELSVAAVSNTREESSSGHSRLDNDITRGTGIRMEVDIFLIAYPFCIKFRKGKTISEPTVMSYSTFVLPDCSIGTPLNLRKSR